jgi:hypothetical protein
MNGMKVIIADTHGVVRVLAVSLAVFAIVSAQTVFSTEPHKSQFILLNAEYCILCQTVINCQMTKIVHVCM